jgi:hypothetical protein
MASTLAPWVDYLKGETRATSFELGAEPTGDRIDAFSIDGQDVKVGITAVK